MSSFLLFQQCTVCLVHLIWMILEMGGRWPYSRCFVGCYFQNLFNIACCIFEQLLSSFFSILFVSFHIVQPYNKMDSTTAREKLCFILSNRSDFHMTDRQSITVHAFASRVLMSLSYWDSSFWGRWTCPQVSEKYILKNWPRCWYVASSICSI